MFKLVLLYKHRKNKGAKGETKTNKVTMQTIIGSKPLSYLAKKHGIIKHMNRTYIAVDKPYIGKNSQGDPVDCKRVIELGIDIPLNGIVNGSIIQIVNGNISKISKDIFDFYIKEK